MYAVQVQLGVSVALPLLVLVVGVPLVLWLCRRRHKRRMQELDARERFLHRCCHDDATAGPNGIQVQHVGEHTLQVSKGRERGREWDVLAL